MSVRPLVCDLPILRQQNDWAIGVGKWPFLLTFSTDIVNHYIVIESISDIVGGWVRKVQNCTDVM